MSDINNKLKQPFAELQLGESPIKDAPRVPLDNGESCIPQHYLLYRHDRESVEKIILDIDYCNEYPVFVGESAQGIYIQVGIIGYDNYPSRKKSGNRKIVYGRKWRVEVCCQRQRLFKPFFSH